MIFSFEYVPACDVSCVSVICFVYFICRYHPQGLAPGVYLNKHLYKSHSDSIDEDDVHILRLFEVERKFHSDSAKTSLLLATCCPL